MHFFLLLPDPIEYSDHITYTFSIFSLWTNKTFHIFFRKVMILLNVSVLSSGAEVNNQKLGDPAPYKAGAKPNPPANQAPSPKKGEFCLEISEFRIPCNLGY